MAFPSYLVAEESWTHASVSESPSIITTPCKGKGASAGGVGGGGGDDDTDEQSLLVHTQMLLYEQPFPLQLPSHRV